MKKIVCCSILAISTAIAPGSSIPAWSAPATYETFADWCVNKAQLTPEARHTVEVLLEKAETQNCDRAQEAIAQLTVLDLSGNSIADVSPLASLTQLTELSLDNNQIADVSPLANLTALTRLGLSWNQIADVSQLASLTALTRLGLSYNQIADVSPLANLTALTILGLSWNQIADVSPLASLTALAELNLNGNQIVDVSPLASLTALHSAIALVPCNQKRFVSSKPTCRSPPSPCSKYKAIERRSLEFSLFSRSPDSRCHYLG